MKFEQKPQSVLKDQLKEAGSRLGANIERPDTEEEIMQMSEQELSECFSVRYDTYVSLLNKNKILSESNLVEMKKWIIALNNLDSYIKEHKQKLANMEQPTLKEKQFDVFEDLRDFLEAGGREGYIKLPTGVGKTVIFIEFIEALKLNTLIVVPKNILVDQTINQISRFAEDLDVGQINKEVKKMGKDVTLITYDSLVDWVKTGKLDTKAIDCLILDEAHRALGPETSAAIADPKLAHAIKLGFTATPKFSTQKQLKNLLETEIHSMDISEAIKEGLLSGCKCIIARTKTDLRGIKVTSNGEYNQAELEKAIDNEARTAAAINLYKKAFSGKKLIIYCGNSVNFAKKVAEAFTAEGISVEAVYGEQTNTVKGAEDQKEILKKLSTGEITGVTNAKVLVEGFDEPSVKVIFNLAPTMSIVEQEQRCGRGLRLYGDEIAVIVDFLDKHDEKNNRYYLVKFLPLQQFLPRTKTVKKVNLVMLDLILMI